MKTQFAICALFLGLCATALQAGGSIGWDEVRLRIAKTDPQLVASIEKNFVVSETGGGVRLGKAFGERAGERIPPYDFDAIRKGTHDHYHLQIEESADFEFTGRYQFTWQVLKGEKTR